MRVNDNMDVISLRGRAESATAMRMAGPAVLMICRSDNISAGCASGDGR